MSELVDGPLFLLLVTGFLMVPTALAAAATALVWVHRARTNAALLSPHLRLRYSPTASVLLLLIPVANAYFIGPILGDIRAASFPYGHDERGTRLVRAFWATTVVTAAVAGTGNLVLSAVSEWLFAPGRAAGEAAAHHVTAAALTFQTVTYLLAVASAVLFALVVRHISRLQTRAHGRPLIVTRVTPPHPRPTVPGRPGRPTHSRRRNR
ncbi:DUF4328 domain-containing protein [Pseudonocardia zijingensis]|uniref:DUF4328 domain-containing protein n=1 Tax=Pseudonocardia zijingensis TaxID=153376 RepID=A0ABN1NGK9_9PSEU